jgi:hypothetical protein
MADPVAGGLVYAGVDELGEHPVGADHAERAVPGVDQADGGLDDPPQGRGQLQAAGHPHHGVQQVVQLVLRGGDLGQPVGDLVQQLGQPQPGQGAAEPLAAPGLAPTPRPLRRGSRTPATLPRPAPAAGNESPASGGRATGTSDPVRAADGTADRDLRPRSRRVGGP